jgi:outer membrane protein TolC
MPELNVKGSYGYNGLGVNADEAWEKIKAKGWNTWSVGVQLRMPLLFGFKERNMIAAERYKKQMAEENLQAIEYGVAGALKNIRQRIYYLRERVKNAETVVNCRKRLLDVEMLRFSAGKSNSRLIFDVEEKLASAKQLQLESIVRYRESLSQYSLISGMLLREKGLETVENNHPVVVEAVNQR